MFDHPFDVGIEIWCPKMVENGDGVTGAVRDRSREKSK